MNAVTAQLLEQVERIRSIIEENAAKAEATRQLPQVVYDAMDDAGLFAMLAPKAYGGYELHLVEAMRVWEAVARIDAAAAWNLSMGQGIAQFAAWLPEAGVKELYAEGPTTVAGTLNPPTAATRVEGGWRITGQCPYGSGCHNAKWLAMPALEMNGDQPKVDPETGQPTPFGVFFPSSKAKILDTWHTLGMRGTGSMDYAVEDLFIPDHMVAPVAPLSKPAAGFEGPLYRIWPWTPIFGEATASVGTAAAAVDAATELCKHKTAAFNVTALRDQQLAHFQLGKAKSRVDAARDTLYGAATEAHNQVERTGGLLTVESKIRLQLAACFAAEAVRWVHDVAVASAIRTEQPFERYFRDAHTLLQHASKSSARYASAGRIMVGLETDWVWLTF